MSNPEISDYAGYDYKQAYWQRVNREYEHQVELVTLRRLLCRFPRFDRLLDAGCGFGRLFPAYSDRAQRFILLDYAANLLEQARSEISSPNVDYIQGNLYEIPLQDACVDAIVTIRTLHHFQKPDQVISQFYRVLQPKGILIMEIPNKRHVVNMIKFVLGRQKTSPFSKDPLMLSKTFLNFHPSHIFSLLQTSGFEILEIRSTSFFRITWLKKVISTPILVGLDLCLQPFLSKWMLTPSIFVLCKKR